MQKFTVSRDDSIYEAWPDVALCPSGKLVCVFTECEHHGNRDASRLVWVTSTDRGRTWSKKRYLTEKGSAAAFFNCARISALRDGRLAIVCDYVVGKGEDPDFREKTVNYLWFSSDEGETWTDAVETPIRGIVPDRLLELASGRWLIAAHCPSVHHKKLSEYLWYSDDKGVTWSERVTVASDEHYNLCEASLVEVEPDKLVAFMRENSGIGTDCLKAISYDGGEHFEGVYNVPLPACHRPTAGFLSDGRLLVTFRFMQGGKGWLGAWTQNTFGAILSRDGLLSPMRHGQATRIFPIDYDRSTVSDGGYTGWVQFPDGEVYVVNYIVDDAPKAQIRGYSFYPSELIIDASEL